MDLLRGEVQPRHILTRQALRERDRVVAATGGSTNAVLHLLAIAREAGVGSAIDDFDAISARVPLLADLKPSGRFVATDLHAAGGTRLLAQRLPRPASCTVGAHGERQDDRGGGRAGARGPGAGGGASADRSDQPRAAAW